MCGLFSNKDLGSKLFEGTSYSKVHGIKLGLAVARVLHFELEEFASLFGGHVTQAFCPGVALVHAPALSFVCSCTCVYIHALFF